MDLNGEDAVSWKFARNHHLFLVRNVNKALKRWALGGLAPERPRQVIMEKYEDEDGKFLKKERLETMAEKMEDRAKANPQAQVVKPQRPSTSGTRGDTYTWPQRPPAQRKSGTGVILMDYVLENPEERRVVPKPEPSASKGKNNQPNQPSDSTIEKKRARPRKDSKEIMVNTKAVISTRPVSKRRGRKRQPKRRRSRISSDEESDIESESEPDSDSGDDDDFRLSNSVRTIRTRKNIMHPRTRKVPVAKKEEVSNKKGMAPGVPGRSGQKVAHLYDTYGRRINSTDCKRTKVSVHKQEAQFLNVMVTTLSARSTLGKGDSSKRSAFTMPVYVPLIQKIQTNEDTPKAEKLAKADAKTSFKRSEVGKTKTTDVNISPIRLTDRPEEAEITFLNNKAEDQKHEQVQVVQNVTQQRQPFISGQRGIPALLFLDKHFIRTHMCFLVRNYKKVQLRDWAGTSILRFGPGRRARPRRSIPAIPGSYFTMKQEIRMKKGANLEECVAQIVNHHLILDDGEGILEAAVGPVADIRFEAEEEMKMSQAVVTQEQERIQELIEGGTNSSIDNSMEDPASTSPPNELI